MNSARPFATVVILTVIGIGLYMVINTSDPVPPEEAADAMLAIPEIEDDPAAFVDEGTTEASAAAEPAAPFPSESETGLPPQWSGATPGWPDPASTSSAPPLPVESPTSPLPRSAGESLPSADGGGTTSGGANAFSAQLQTQIEGSTSPESVANPYVPPGPSGHQHLGNVPSAHELQPPPGGSIVAGSPLPSDMADGRAGLPAAEGGAVQRPATTFTVVWQAVQESLRRGELSQALLTLSDFYGDPQLTPAEQQELNTLLSQLAGTVIYSTSHELEQPHRVQPGETLATIADVYNITPELLAKINGLADPSHLAPGTELKVVRGPFHAIVDPNGLRLVLDGRYAGRFPAQAPSAWPADSWTVQQKVPAGDPTAPSQFATNGRHIVLVPADSNSAAPPAAIVGNSAVPAGEPGSIVRVSPHDLADLYDILTIGSRVTVRR